MFLKYFTCSQKLVAAALGPGLLLFGLMQIHFIELAIA